MYFPKAIIIIFLMNIKSYFFKLLKKGISELVLECIMVQNLTSNAPFELISLMSKVRYFVYAVLT